MAGLLDAVGLRFDPPWQLDRLDQMNEAAN
jgi:hypothetical protein